MTKLDSDSLKKFLAGKSSESEAAAIERALTDSQVIMDTSVSAADDSLVAALRSPNPGIPSADSDTAALVEQISQLHPRRTISIAELERLLEPAAQPGDLGKIGRYRVLELLASGGMGLVFRAVDSKLDRLVCIKLLDPTFQFNTRAVARFERESHQIARLQHERIITVLDMGHCRGLPWFAMPLLRGMSLRTRLRTVGPLDESTALRYLRQTAYGLEYAHQHGLLHRDIKPDNLWITETDDIKILDFGLARPSENDASLSQPGTLIGTPSYMSPEQITGKPLDPRSDLFGVGAVLVEMLTGKSPFQRDNVISTLLSVANEPISFEAIDPQRQISPAVRRLIRDLLRIDPARRIASASDLVRRLDELQEAGTAPRVGQVGLRGWGWRSALAGAVLGVAACFGSWALWACQDKGTLVVEAHDSAVEIKIESERVTVVDPLTEKQYEIRVGATPLPSGVYQLEMADPSGDLAFSSSTIAIRRGQRTIVQVTLRPPTSGEPAPIASASNSTGAANKPPSQPAANFSPADPSFDPAARERFGDLLPTLSAILILPTTSGTLPPLTESASVQQPWPLGENTSWTLETPQHGHQMATNCDGTLFAALEKDIVWIRDIHGVTRYALPLRGQTGFEGSVRFDNRYPNLLSASSYIAGDESESSGANAYEISIWRLGEDHAELLFRLPASNIGLAAWDRGYRLAYFRDERLSFFRLDNGVTTPIEGISLASQSPLTSDRLQENSISPDGRWLATRANVGGGNQVNVWDLQLGQFMFSVLENESWQWSSDSTKLAASPNYRNFSGCAQFQIWDVNKKLLLQSILLDRMEPKPFHPPPIVATALDADFARVAWLTRDGELCIRSLENNRQASVTLDSTDPPLAANLAWQSERELAITTATSQAIWRSTESEVQGTITRTAGTFYLPTWIGNRRAASFRIHSLDGVTDTFATISWPFEQSDRDDQANLGGTAAIDLKRLGTNSGQIVFASTAARQSGRNDEDSRIPRILSFSPNGQFCVYQMQGQGRSQRQRQFISLAASNKITELGDLLMLDDTDFGMLGSSVAWTPDSRYCGLMGQDVGQRTRDFRIRILDTASITINEIDATQFPEWPLVHFTSWAHGFLASFQPRDRSGPRLKTVFLDPTNLQVSEFKLLEDFQNVNVLWQADDQVVFQANRFDDPLDGTRRFRLPKHLIRATVSGDQLTNVQSIPRSQFIYVTVSPDGKFLLTTRSAADNDREQVISIQALPAAFDGSPSKPLFEQKSSSYRNPHWHPSGNVAAFMSLTQGLCLYDTTSGQLKTLGRSFSSDQFKPTSFGWYVAVGNELVALTLGGEYLGRAVITQTQTDKPPSLDYWILADGSLSQDGNLAGAMAVYVAGNRVYCRNAQDYVNDSNQPALPRVETLPFLSDPANNASPSAASDLPTDAAAAHIKDPEKNND